MPELYNLIVDLHERCAGWPEHPAEAADERTLAWIDETFGGFWSSEAYAGANVVARRDGAPIGFATIAPQGLNFRWLRGAANQPSVGVFGPFGVSPEERGSGVGVDLLRGAMRALHERGHEQALICAVGSQDLIAYYADAVGALIAERYDRAALLAPPPRTLVLASGNGSNFQAVIDAVRDGTLPVQIVGLVCNNSRAKAVERARDAEIPVQLVFWERGLEPRAAYDARLHAAVDSFAPDLVLLLGWMHLLAPEFVRAFPEMLNLHPAFLPLDPDRDVVGMPDGSEIPAFRGPRAMRDTLAAGSKWAGATVHRVTPATDRGPVFARKPMGLEPGEDEDRAMQRLHEIEHRLVVTAVTRWLFERP